MSGWLMAPERLPSYFARDTEPPPAMPRRRLKSATLLVWIGTAPSCSARSVAQKIAAAIQRQNKGSAAAW